MSFFDIVLIGISLAMDAVCVSVSNGISMNGNKLKLASVNALAFGIFQGIMPLIGFLAGSFFANIFFEYGDYIVAFIFLILGLKMIIDGCKKNNKHSYNNFTFKLLIAQAIATSIDALAVGIGFSAIKLNIFVACSIISTVTIILTFIGFLLGNKIKMILNNKSEIFAGILLILISLRTVIPKFI